MVVSEGALVPSLILTSGERDAGPRGASSVEEARARGMFDGWMGFWDSNGDVLGLVERVDPLGPIIVVSCKEAIISTLTIDFSKSINA